MPEERTKVLRVIARLNMGGPALHVAYLSISSREGTNFADQARLMAYAARVMRGLVKHAEAAEKPSDLLPIIAAGIKVLTGLQSTVELDAVGRVFRRRTLS